jgi:hypothetical protein
LHRGAGIVGFDTDHSHGSTGRLLVSGSLPPESEPLA